MEACKMITNPFKTPDSIEQAQRQLETAKQQYQHHKSQESYHKHMAAYYAKQAEFYTAILTPKDHEPNNF